MTVALMCGLCRTSQNSPATVQPASTFEGRPSDAIQSATAAIRPHRIQRPVVGTTRGGRLLRIAQASSISPARQVLSKKGCSGL
jgi:hypothetical protein